MRIRTAIIIVFVFSLVATLATPVSASPDTGQDHCYDTSGNVIPCPEPGDALFGQDANYQGAVPAYQENGDGTVTDLNTGLIWQQTPGPKVTWDEAMATAETLTLGGMTGWRVPTIKELYTLIDFNGVTVSSASTSTPYLDTGAFDFEYGDTSAGERFIDAQYWSSTEYGSTTMGDNPTVFGVNFADGRIKGYPKTANGTAHEMFVRYVVGSSDDNQFIDNGNGTITDLTTGLTWTQNDSGAFGAGSRGDGSINWEEALAFCETVDFAGADDWRLPDAKELQFIVDYSRSPDITNSAAIDPLFQVTSIIDEGGQINYPFYWTSTTHLDGQNPGSRAVYVAFGEALGFMETPSGSGNHQLLDVHGAGAQRSDPKTGDPANFPTGLGPQGDVIRIYNYARCVRGGSVQIVTGGAVDQADVTAALGQSAHPPQAAQPTPGGAPPQKAITACSGLTQGSLCAFQSPQDTIRGTCESVQNQLACVPTGGPPQ